VRRKQKEKADVSLQQTMGDSIWRLL